MTKYTAKVEVVRRLTLEVEIEAASRNHALVWLEDGVWDDVIEELDSVTLSIEEVEVYQ